MFEVDRIYCSDITGLGVRPFPDLVFEVERILQTNSLIVLRVIQPVLNIVQNWHGEQEDRNKMQARPFGMFNFS